MEGLFCTVLNMSLTAALVILPVLGARLLLGKAPRVISYALWAVVLFRLLCPVSVTAPVSVLDMTRPGVTQLTEGTSSISYLPQAAPAQEDVPAQEIPREQRSAAGLTAWAAWSWAAGVAAMALHGLVSCLSLCRRLMGAVPWGPGVYLADHIPTPFVLGILRPRIYLPSDTPAGERSFILAHERHHIRRGDHIIKPLAYGALCLHWFNPLVWLAFLLAGKDMEMSCDEAVIRKLGPEIRADYARSLLRLAGSRPVIGGAPLAFGQGDTKGRVKHMAKWKKPPKWVVSLSLGLCVLVAVFCVVNPGENPVAAAETEADYLEICREALEEIQNQADFCVSIHRTYYGYDVLNSTSEDTYWQHGQDWLKITRIPEDGWKRGYSQHGCLYVDGVYYSNNNYDQAKWDEDENILWSEGGIDAGARPWIARFRWDAQQVRYVSAEEEGTETRITLKVEGPYYDTHTEGSCLMQFIFDRKGNLLRLENEVDTTGLQGAKQVTNRFTEIIQPSRDAAEKAIQKEYTRYLNGA